MNDLLQVSGIKTDTEIAALREAAGRSAEAHGVLMGLSWVGRRELDLAERFALELRHRGITEIAYPTIVGAGERALILHAEPTERILSGDDMIVVDAGGKWNGLCADITRTYPVGRSFSSVQRRLYGIVLEAQKRAIALVRPGMTLDEIHLRTREWLGEGLKSAGWLVEGRSDLFDRWYPHKTSHWLGREVHDPFPYKRADGSAVPLAPGMVFTIEPGLYIDGPEAPAELRGLGVRIEDDVLVTEIGAEVLTSKAAKEIEEIEEHRRTHI